MPEDDEREDENTEAKRAVGDLTGEAGEIDAGDLLESDELKRQLTEAKRWLKSPDN